MSARHTHLGRLPDLDETVKCPREGLALCKEGTVEYNRNLHNLSARLCKRFGESKDPKDKDEAMGITKEILKATPVGSFEQGIGLDDFGQSFKIPV